MIRWLHLCVAMLFISVEVRAVPSEVLSKDGQAFSKSIAFQDKLELNLDFGNSSDYVPYSEFNITINGLILKFVGKEHEENVLLGVLLEVTAVFGEWSTSPVKIRSKLEKLVVYENTAELFAEDNAHTSTAFVAPAPIFFPGERDVLVSLTSTSPIPKSLVISYDPLVTTTVEPITTTQEPLVTTTVEPDQEEEEEPTVSISEQTPEETDEPDEEEGDVSSTFEPTVLEPTVSTPEATTTKQPATESTKAPEKPATTSSAKTTPEKPAVTEPPPAAAKLEDQKKKGKLEPNKLTYLVLASLE